jgi:hypothetical protein
MRRALTVLACSAALLAAALPGTAAAAKPRFWATVNVCKSAVPESRVGFRASMPGNGTRQRMYMRFTAQFFDGDDQAWKPIGGKPRSPWVLAGSARYVTRQRGYTFDIDPPPAGKTYKFRGFVEFQWRARKRGGGTKVVRELEKYTRGGYGNTVGSDPKGYSSAFCKVTGPAEQPPPVPTG